MDFSRIWRHDSSLFLRLVTILTDVQLCRGLWSVLSSPVKHPRHQRRELSQYKLTIYGEFGSAHLDACLPCSRIPWLSVLLLNLLIFLPLLLNLMVGTIFLFMVLVLLWTFWHMLSHTNKQGFLWCIFFWNGTTRLKGMYIFNFSVKLFSKMIFNNSLSHQKCINVSIFPHCCQLLVLSDCCFFWSVWRV